MGNNITSNSNSVLKKTTYNCSSQYDWKCIKTIACKNWKSNIAHDLSFDSKAEWLYHNLTISHSIWSGYVVKGSDVSGKQQVICQLDDNTFKSRVCSERSWINKVSILTFNDNSIVIQAVTLLGVTVIVVNLKNGLILGEYTFTKVYALQECLLSGDSKFMLCREDSVQKIASGHECFYNPDIVIIEIKNGQCQFVRSIMDKLAFGRGSALAFDPRYAHGRFAVFTSQFQEVDRTHLHTNRECEKVFTYDLRSSSVVTSAKSAPSRVVHHIKYSTDGKLIAVICVDIDPYIAGAFKLSAFLLYCPDTLNIIRSFNTTSLSYTSQILSQYPMFSRSGELMAYHTHGLIRVIKLPDCTVNLQDKCRLVIRRQVKRTDVIQLPLPEKLKNYLAFLE